ncbi:MAG TPA: DMT family transporter [Thermoanaerobaculia bacterium]|nr:DMT family transporter [Thermoanaerobaculia bacterium]
MDQRAASRLRLLAAAGLFSTGAAGIKATTLTGWQVAGLRSGVAALALLVLLPQARQLNRPRVWLVGCAYAGTLVCYAVANKLTTAANTIFLQSTAPLYVLLLAPLLLREPVRRRDLLLMAWIAAGMAFFFVGQEEPTRLATNPLLGNLLGLASGAFWAVTLMGLRWLERSTADSAGGLGAASVVAGNTLAFLLTLPFALPIAAAHPADAAWILYLGVVQIGLAYYFLTAAMGQVPALEASLLLMLEPVLTPLWAWAMHGETPSGWALVGGAVILAATVTKTVAEGWELRALRRRT